MKILFLIMRFKRDGLATNVLELTKGLVARGHEIQILTSGFNYGTSSDTTFFNQLENEFAQMRVKIYYFKEPKGNIFKKSYLSFTSMSTILYRLLALEFDLIHCHSPNMTLFPWILRKKCITTVHSDTIRPNFRYKHPAIVIAVSSGAKKFTETIMGTDSKTIRKVNHGISPRFSIPEKEKRLLELKKENRIPRDKKIIGFVGRITPKKGTDILLNAIGRHLSDELKEKIHIVLVGDLQSESYKTWYNELVVNNKLEQKLTLLSFRDPKPYYQLFDVFVLPSRIDTFGLVSVEAMMSGCCTIRSNSYGAEDQIDHGTNGFIYPMEDEKKLATLLERVIKDNTLRGQLAKNGKEKALANFTKDKMVENTIKVYDEFIKL